MSSTSGIKPASRRTRKSIAIVPHHEAPKPASSSDKENGASRRTRSRSLGPGGLEELNSAVEKDNTFAFGGISRRRRESTAPPAPPPRSILKAQLPLSPIQPIPNFRKRSAAPTEKRASPTRTTVTVPLMTEEEQQRRERERERQEITAARAERRKSLGNRRVSFAPEATLHTWGKNERIENGDNDLTGSTDNSNAQTPDRRRRSIDSIDEDESSLPNMPATPAGAGRSVGFGSDDSIASSSPFGSSPGNALPEHNPELDAPEEDSDLDSSSDDDDTTMHRTISAPTDDLTGSSMFDAIAEEEISEEVTTNPAPNVMKSFFRKPITVIGSNKRQSVGRAPPKKPVQEEEDDDGEMTMDITKPIGGLLKTLEKQQQEMDETMGEATMDMTRPVGGFMKSVPQQRQASSEDSDSGEMTMDITRPIGGLIKDAQPSYPQLPQQDSDSEDVTMDVTMDVTKAIGGIISSGPVSYPKLSQQRDPYDVPESESELSELSDEDMSMEFTAVVGGIKPSAQPTPAKTTKRATRRSLAASKRRVSTATNVDEDGDMTMDFTMNVGKILHAPAKEATPKTAATPAAPRIRVSSAGSPNVMGGKGTPQSASEDSEEPSTSFDDRVGGIETLKASTATPEKAAETPAGRGRRRKSDVSAAPEKTETPPVKKKRGRPSNAEIAARKAAEEAEAAKASDASQSQSQSVSAEPEAVTTPPSTGKRRGRPPRAEATSTTPTTAPAVTEATATPPSLAKKRGRPSKADIAAREEAAKAATPPSVKRGPGRPSKAELAAREAAKSSSPASVSEKSSTPEEDPSPTGRRRRQSKVTIAAPEAAAAAAESTPTRRQSKAATIQQTTPVPAAPSPLRNVETVAAQTQTPLRNVQFAEPAQSPFKTPSKPLSIDDAKIFLASTPKRRLSSIAMARSPYRTTPRRQSLLNTPVSFTPVKTMDLLAAIAHDKQERKEEITKEFEERNQGYKRALDETLDLAERIEAMTPRKKRAVEIASPPKPAPVATPKTATPKATTPSSTKRRGRPPRARIESPRSSPQAVNVNDENTTKIPLADSPIAQVYDGPKLSVEDFCKETEVTFLDTLTAKRRQTAATVVPRNSSGSFTGIEANPSLADRIVSGASTTLLLNMYVHGCRELKRHVQDYKRDLRVLEQEANEDMPMIMQEFATATPQGQAAIKTMMGAMKKFSRGKAKIEWYAWRGNLCVQLRAALEADLKNLQDDLEKIREWRKMTAEPAKLLTETQIALQEQAAKAVELKEKIMQTDPEVLRASREKLVGLRAQLEEKSRRVAELQTQCEMDESAEKEMGERAKTLGEENDELKRAHEANRMMKADEIKLYKAKIDKYATTTKWRVHKCTEEAIELTFDNFLLLTLFLNGSKSTITFLPDTSPTQAEEILLSLITSIIPSSTPTNADRRRLTSRISTFWTHVATPLSSNIQTLHRLYRLRTFSTSPYTISSTLKLVIPDVGARVDVTFLNQFAPDLSSFETSMSAEFVYRDFEVQPNILKRMREGRPLKSGEEWMSVVGGVREKVRSMTEAAKEAAKEAALAEKEAQRKEQERALKEQQRKEAAEKVVKEIPKPREIVRPREPTLPRELEDEVMLDVDMVPPSSQSALPRTPPPGSQTGIPRKKKAIPVPVK